VAQITAIVALLLYQPLIPGIDTIWLGTVALWVAAILTLWSMLHYLRLAAPHLSPSALTPLSRSTTSRIEPGRPDARK
jgi:phosphatidylglycerophosphate synthase